VTPWRQKLLREEIFVCESIVYGETFSGVTLYTVTSIKQPLIISSNCGNCGQPCVHLAPSCPLSEYAIFLLCIGVEYQQWWSNIEVLGSSPLSVCTLLCSLPRWHTCSCRFWWWILEGIVPCWGDQAPCTCDVCTCKYVRVCIQWCMYHKFTLLQVAESFLHHEWIFDAFNKDGDQLDPWWTYLFSG